MPQAVVLQSIDNFQYRTYTKGQVVDFPAAELSWLKSRNLVDDTSALVAAAVAGVAAVVVHRPGPSPATEPVSVDIAGTLKRPGGAVVASSAIASVVADGLGALKGGSLGRLIAAWPALTGQVGGTLTTVTDALGATKPGVRLVRGAGGAFAECAVALEQYTPAKGAYPTLAVEVSNPSENVVDFGIRLAGSGGKAIIYGGSIKPTGGVLQRVSMSRRATTGDTGWNFATPDKITAVRVMILENGPNGAGSALDQLTFGEVCADIKGKANIVVSIDDVPSNAVRPITPTLTTPASCRSALEVLAAFRLKAIFYIVPGLVGGALTNITQQEVLAIPKAGHMIGAHSLSHPIDQTGAGLRLLGPYGYNRSRASRAANATEAVTALDCRVISTNSATGTFTTENPHLMSTGGKLTFYDPAQLPTGCALNTTYYFINTGASTFKLATTAGNANSGTAIALPANWAGLAEWRWPGSRPDDTAIYEDHMAGITGLSALGVTGHEPYFALPQGGWDHYVRSAIERSPTRHTRGIASPNSNHRDILIGWPTGGSASSTPYWVCGWPQAQWAMTSDQGATLAQLIAAIDEAIEYGYTLFLYHHSITDTPDVLYGALAYARTKIDQGLLENPSLEELAIETRLF